MQRLRSSYGSHLLSRHRFAVTLGSRPNAVAIYRPSNIHLPPHHHSSTLASITALIPDLSLYAKSYINAVHEYSYLPWWASIALSTIVVRTALLPLARYQTSSSEKVAHAMKDMSYLMHLFSVHTKRRAEEEKIPRVTAMQQEAPRLLKGMGSVMTVHGASVTSAVLPMVLNLSIFITFVYSVRFMVQDPSYAETLRAGGAFWFPDLTMKDKHFYLPLAAALINYISLDVILPAKGLSPRILLFKDFSQSATVVFFPVMLTIPSGVFMYWIPSGLFTIFQRKLFTNNKFREMVGLTPIQAPPQSPASQQPEQPASAASTTVVPSTAAATTTATTTANTTTTTATTTATNASNGAVAATESSSASKKGKKRHNSTSAATITSDIDVSKLSRKDRIKLAKYGKL